MSNGTSDLDRVEKLFNKALWAVGVLGTIAIGSGAAVVFSFNSQLSDTITRAEQRIAEISETAQTRISDISQTAESRIREQAEKVSTNLEERLMSNIDLQELVASAKQTVEQNMLQTISSQNSEMMQRFDDAQAATSEEVDAMVTDTRVKLVQIHEAVKTYKSDVEEIQAELAQLVDQRRDQGRRGCFQFDNRATSSH